MKKKTLISINFKKKNKITHIFISDKQKQINNIIK